MAIYVLKRKADGAFKVGYSDRVRQRIQDQTSKVVGEIEAVGSWQGDRATELAAHNLLQEYRIGRTDWFTSECEGKLREWLSGRPLAQPRTPSRTTRDQRIDLRVTEDEKRWYIEEAGSTSALSQWIRDTLNHVVENRRLDGTKGLQEFIKTNLEPSEPLTRETLDRAMFDAPQPRGAGTLTSLPEVPLRTSKMRMGEHTPRAPIARQCPRWMHHRKGAYCSSCGKLN